MEQLTTQNIVHYIGHTCRHRNRGGRGGKCASKFPIEGVSPRHVTTSSSMFMWHVQVAQLQ